MDSGLATTFGRFCWFDLGIARETPTDPIRLANQVRSNGHMWNRINSVCHGDDA